MAARLKSLDHAQVLAVDQPLILVGRHAECDLQLESSKISRKHCLLALAEPYLLVRDLESTNGVRVNGEKVQEGKLRSGDELMIGNLRFRLEIDENGAAGPTPLPRAVDKSSPVPGVPVAPIPASHLISCDFPIPIIEDDMATVGPTLDSSKEALRRKHRQS